MKDTYPDVFVDHMAADPVPILMPWVFVMGLLYVLFGFGAWKLMKILGVVL